MPRGQFLVCHMRRLHSERADDFLGQHSGRRSLAARPARRARRPSDTREISARQSTVHLCDVVAACSYRRRYHFARYASVEISESPRHVRVGVNCIRRSLADETRAVRLLIRFVLEVRSPREVDQPVVVPVTIGEVATLHAFRTWADKGIEHERVHLAGHLTALPAGRQDQGRVFAWPIVVPDQPWLRRRTRVAVARSPASHSPHVADLVPIEANDRPPLFNSQIHLSVLADSMHASGEV